jgi:hypothetical protein
MVKNGLGIFAAMGENAARSGMVPTGSSASRTDREATSPSSMPPAPSATTRTVDSRRSKMPAAWRVHLFVSSGCFHVQAQEGQRITPPRRSPAAGGPAQIGNR